MSNRNVYLDGTSGTYIAVTATNLLPAHYANVEQAVVEAGASDDFSIDGNLSALSKDTGVKYGDWPTVKATADGVGAASLICGLEGNDMKVAATTQYTLSAFVHCSASGIEANLEVVDYDSGDTVDATPTVGTYTEDISTDASNPTRITVTRTTAADADHLSGKVTFRKNAGTAPDSGTVLYVGKLQLEAAAAATDWEPSVVVLRAYDLRIDMEPDSWTPAGNQALMSRYDTTGDKRSFLWYLNTANGDHRMLHSNDGAGQESEQNTATDLAGRSERRITYDGTDTVEYFHRPNPSTAWTSDLTDTFTTETGQLHYDVTDPNLDVGIWRGISEPFAGKIYGFSVRDGIGGPVIASFDGWRLTTADVAAGTHTTPEGHAVTLSGAWTFDWIGRIIGGGVW